VELREEKDSKKTFEYNSSSFETNLLKRSHLRSSAPISNNQQKAEEEPNQDVKKFKLS